MEFRILGPVAATDSRGEIALGGRRHRVLLATLLMHEGSIVSAERLIETLFGDHETPTARQTLHVRISELRKLLSSDAAADPGPRILTVREGYRLCLAGVDTLDAHQFDQLVSAGREALVHGDAAMAAAQLKAALDLFRGPPLVDLAESPSAQAEIARWENQRSEIHEERFEAELAAGKHRAIVAELQRTVLENPLRERLRAHLMLALYRSGRQSEALDVYRQGADHLREELGIDPGLDLRELRDAILRQEPALRPAVAAVAVPPSNLPAQLTSFIGRQEEIADLEALLTTSRLVTLTGVGGAGKSRLAAEVAAAQLPRFPDGVWMVELAPVTEARLLESTVAGVLRVPEHPQQPVLDSITEALRGSLVLVVIDNCEHLVGPVARMVSGLLANCRQVRVLCTSTERLGIAGEVVRTIRGLATPAADGRSPTAPSDAVQLFTERAAAIRGDQDLDEAGLASVAEICRRLDGLPLAIELAAARTGSLSLAHIAARLDGRFRLLTGGSRDALPRHQTLRAVVDWSYHLLSAQEQRFFDRLAVFVGGFTLEAAEHVAGEDDLEAAADLLARLVDKSLVVTDSMNLPDYRYRLLETLREYGLERLDLRPDADAVRDRHTGYFLGLAREAGAGLRTGAQPVWLQRLREEHSNLRAALGRSISVGDRGTAAALAGSLYPFWDLHGHYSEGRGWLEQVRAPSDGVPPMVRARVLMGIATLAVIQSDLEHAVEACEEAAEISRACGDDAGLSHALQYLGFIATYTGELPRARELLEASVRMAPAEGASWEHGWALIFLSSLSLAETDFVRAADFAREAASVFTPDGDREGLAWALVERGAAAWGQDDPTTAASCLRSALSAFQELGGLWGVSLALSCSGLLVARREEMSDQAVRIFAAAEALRSSVGVGIQWFIEAWMEESLAGLRERLGTVQFDREWSAGADMPWPRAVTAASGALARIRDDASALAVAPGPR